MALSANQEVDRYVDQELRTAEVAGSAHVYKGALVEWNAGGFAQPLAGSGRFAGLAYEEMDNSGGADGDVSGRLFTLGDFGFAVAGATQADVGRAVYATADDTVTFDSASATFVGYVRGVPAAGQVILRLQGEGPIGAVHLEHKSASFSIGAAQSGTTFTNLGAASPITATLPQNPPKGTAFQFVCMADQALRIAPGPAGGVYIKGAKQADNKYISITDIGDFVDLVADGNGDWVAVASIGGADADISVEV